MATPYKSTRVYHVFPCRFVLPRFLSLRFAGGPLFVSAWHYTSSAREPLAHFLWQLRQRQFIRSTQQPCQFLPRQRVSSLQRHPLRPGQVRRRNDVLPLDQLRKILGRCFEREADRRRLERRHRKHFSAHFKHQIVAPLDLLRGSWKRQAQLAQPFRVHRPSLCQKRAWPQSIRTRMPVSAFLLVRAPLAARSQSAKNRNGFS
jgi:hypothetical protein